MQYVFVMRGRLEDALQDLFWPVAVADLDGVTQMTMEIRDDSELYGVLARLEQLGLSIVRVELSPWSGGPDD